MNAKLTKGLAAAAISAAMMLGAAAPALAEDVKTLPNNDGGYYLTKTYEGVHDSTVTENLSFAVTNYKFTDTNDQVTAENMPTASITDVKDATSGAPINLKLNLQKYASAGYYYYKVKENAGNTAGVTYDDHEYYLKVTVSYVKDSDGNIDYHNTKIDSVSLWDVDPTDPTVDITKTDHKVAGFKNTYNSGTLAVKKEIAGNLAQGSDKFKIHVTFTSTKPVGSVVSYTVDGETNSIKAWTESDGTYTASADITVKGGSTVDFSNLPEGVKYSVDETDHGDYTPSYDNNKSGAMKATDAVEDVTTTVTNTKESKVDMGVLLNNAPYIAIIGGAAVVAIYVVNKRRHSDMD
jgi:pilin isopeptide linkage protein